MKNKAATLCVLSDRPTTTIEKVKKGDYFRLVNVNHLAGPRSSVSVYVADGYNRSTKKYSAYRFDDVNHFIERKKGQVVEVGFDF